jgi:hypothetical protein
VARDDVFGITGVEPVSSVTGEVDQLSRLV